MTTYSHDARFRITSGDPPLILRDGLPVRMTRALQHLVERFGVLVRDHNPDSKKVHELRQRIFEEAVRASVYSVDWRDDRHVFDGMRVRERAPELGRHRFLDDQVYHVELDDPDMPVEEALARTCQEMSPCSLLGVKARAGRPSAVFLPDDFEAGLHAVFGSKIAQTVLDEDRLDRLQFLTLLCHREGQRPSKDVPIRFPERVNDDEAYDGLIADLDLAAWADLLDAFQLPEDVTWLQVTILDQEEGFATKGALRRCPENHEPATYRESWKIGLPSAPVPSTSILVMETDRTYTPDASLNLQQVAYNFDLQEQGLLLDTVFIPAVQALLDYGWTSRFRSIDRLLAAGANLRLEPVCRRINLLRRKLAKEGIHRAEVPGIRRKAAPDPTLDPYTVKVPHGSFEFGDWVDLTRDPSLPVGNSTQRYRVVGHSQGNVIEVSPHPWMSVQGGDFDGDDACIQQVTLDLFPNKEFDQTPVSAFREAKLNHRYGVGDPNLRFQQALWSLDRPIGINDILARRLLEEDRLDPEARLTLSGSIQNAIDSAKHAVRFVDHGYKTTAPDHAIDAIRRDDLEAEVICSSLYGPLVAAAQEVMEDDLQPEPFDRTPIWIAWADMVARIPNDALVRVSQFAGSCQQRFIDLCRQEPTEYEMDMLADTIHVSMEEAVKVLETYPVDVDDWEGTPGELCLTCLEIGLLRRGSLHMAARVVRMQTLKRVFGSAVHCVQ